MYAIVIAFFNILENWRCFICWDLKKILKFRASNKSQRFIADSLKISRNTVSRIFSLAFEKSLWAERTVFWFQSDHRRNIYRKTGKRKRTGSSDPKLYRIRNHTDGQMWKDTQRMEDRDIEFVYMGRWKESI